jgi:hypothetical protein
MIVRRRRTREVRQERPGVRGVPMFYEVMGTTELGDTPSTFPDIPSAILCWVKLLFKVGAK